MASDEHARFDFDQWADEPSHWNQETGAPGMQYFGNAIQVWAVFQNRINVSVADAAAAFNCDPARIIEAVEEQGWMDVEGPRDDFTRLIIVHDGE